MRVRSVSDSGQGTHLIDECVLVRLEHRFSWPKSRGPKAIRRVFKYDREVLVGSRWMKQDWEGRNEEWATPHFPSYPDQARPQMLLILVRCAAGGDLDSFHAQPACGTGTATATATAPGMRTRHLSS
jgi:hypothetical protein